MSGTSENHDETAAYIEDRMRQIVLDTITVLTTRPDQPLPSPVGTTFDYARQYLYVDVADETALAVWRRQLMGPDLGDTYTVASWCGWWTTVRVAQRPGPVQTVRSGWDPYAIPTGTERQQVIAGLRLLATLLEDRPELPTPTSVTAQASITTGPRAERLAVLADVADALDRPVLVAPDDVSAEVTYRLSGTGLPLIRYVAYSTLPAPTTAEVVSAALEA